MLNTRDTNWKQADFHAQIKGEHREILPGPTCRAHLTPQLTSELTRRNCAWELLSNYLETASELLSNACVQQMVQQGSIEREDFIAAQCFLLLCLHKPCSTRSLCD